MLSATSSKPRAPLFTLLGSKLGGHGPELGLILLCIAGALLNPDFLSVGNVMNVLTRTAFIGIIAIGMCFVIVTGGIDLSVGSMAALLAGVMVIVMNALAGKFSSPLPVIVIGIAITLV